jgi:hypothetical protein
MFEIAAMMIAVNTAQTIADIKNGTFKSPYASDAEMHAAHRNAIWQCAAMSAQVNMTEALFHPDPAASAEAMARSFQAITDATTLTAQMALDELKGDAT